MVWEGSGVRESEWVVLLSESHLQEIDNAREINIAFLFKINLS